MERFSILLDASYLIKGKTKFTELDVYRDLSGISASVSVKAYLF